MPADSGMKSEYCKVYSAAQDGNLAEIRSVCRGDKIIFSVTSLGNFVIAEQLPVEGDVSGDGRVTVADALMVLQCCVGAIEFDERQTNSADVDLSGRVDTTDALMILQFTVKKIDKFPPADKFTKRQASRFDISRLTQRIKNQRSRPLFRLRCYFCHTLRHI